MSCAIVWIFTFTFLEAVFTGLRVWNYPELLEGLKTLEKTRKDDPFVAKYTQIMNGLVIVSILVLIMTLYVLASMGLALNGNTHYTIVHRKNLVRAMTVYAFKTWLGYAALGVGTYLVSESLLVHSIEWCT